MYFIYELILLIFSIFSIFSIFQFETNFKRGCVLVLLSILFFGLDTIQDFLKKYNNVKKQVIVNLTSKDVEITKDLNKI